MRKGSQHAGAAGRENAAVAVQLRPQSLRQCGQNGIIEPKRPSRLIRRRQGRQHRDVVCRRISEGFLDSEGEEAEQQWKPKLARDSVAGERTGDREAAAIRCRDLDEARDTGCDGGT